jgi:hypothetical protein
MDIEGDGMSGGVMKNKKLNAYIYGHGHRWRRTGRRGEELKNN